MQSIDPLAFSPEDRAALDMLHEQEHNVRSQLQIDFEAELHKAVRKHCPGLRKWKRGRLPRAIEEEIFQRHRINADKITGSYQEQRDVIVRSTLARRKEQAQ